MDIIGVFKEDEWRSFVKIGEKAIFSYGKPCNRCLSVQIDPESGHLDYSGDPLRTLKDYRQVDQTHGWKWLKTTIGTSPIFGTNFGILKEGQINVGDEVFTIC